MISEEDFETAMGESFDEGLPLGSGKDGQVIEYTNRLNGAKFALKCIPLSDSKSSQQQTLEIKAKIELFSQQTKKIILHPHPNIVRILYFFISNDNSKFYIFMEKMRCTLSFAIKTRISQNNNYFSSSEIRTIFISLVKTFAFLERLKIAHRDIKSDNLMFSDEGSIKVVDLGESELGKVNRETISIEIQGTVSYLAPELRWMFDSSLKTSEKPTNVYKCDVFSLGVVFLQTACLKPIAKMKGVNKKVEGPQKIKELLIEVEERYGSSYKSLIQLMLTLNPSERPSFIELEDYIMILDKNENEEAKIEEESKNEEAKQENNKKEENKIEKYEKKENESSSFIITVEMVFDIIFK